MVQKPLGEGGGYCFPPDGNGGWRWAELPKSPAPEPAEGRRQEIRTQEEEWTDERDGKAQVRTGVRGHRREQRREHGRPGPGLVWGVPGLQSRGARLFP